MMSRAPRRPPTATAWLACLLALGVAVPGWAGDPARVWRTLDAGRVRVHYSQGSEEIAQRAAWAALDTLDRVGPRLGWAPAADDTPIELVVRDDSEAANGSASVVPRDRVEIFSRPPSTLSALADHDDWVHALVTHEVTHILHLGVIGGLPRWINAGLGRTLAPNVMSPPWLTEGLAVYEETDRTSGGRGRASLFDMFTRTAALGPGLPDLHEMSGDTRLWPGGFVRYVYGGRFVTWLARHRGEKGIALFAREYGGRIIPFALNRTADLAFNEDLVTLWDAWREHERRTAAERMGRRAIRGLTASERLTRNGYEARGLRLRPDGRALLYKRGGGDVVSALRLLPLGPDGRPVGPDRRLVRAGSAGGASWDPTDGTIVLAQRAPWRQHDNYSDLVRLDPHTGVEAQLTRGLRARDPDVGPDGRIAFVINATASSSLAIGAPDMQTWRTIDLPGVREVDAPRWSPTGDRIVVSGWRDGGERDLYLVTVDGGGAPRRLTRDRALDLDPAWTEDGAGIWFSSDRAGVFDLFVYDLQADVVRRATRVSTGAFDPAPAPAAGAVLFVGYGPGGFDVHRTEAVAVADLPPALPDDGPPRPQHVVSAMPLAGFVDEPYEPGATLLPRNWFPVVVASPGVLSLGATVGAADVLRHHRYVLQATGGGAVPHLGLFADYAYSRLYPTLGLTLTRQVRDRGDAVRAAGERQAYVDERFGVSTGLSLPFSGQFHSQSLSVRYGLELLRPVTDPDDIEHDPGVASPIYPSRGVSTAARVGWAYRRTERPPWAVSTEAGSLLALSMVLRHPSLMAEDDSVRLTWSGQTYALAPWATDQHHALSVRYAGGIGSGGLRSRRLFFLGGVPEQDVFTSVLDGTFVGASHLRGYPRGLTRGDQEHLVTAEYRLPVAAFLRGLLTIPLYLDRLTAAAFTDYGAAMGRRFDVDELRLGVGGELRLSLTLAYFMPASLRFGVAQGLMKDGELQTYLLAGNFF